jgi:hypothetical protein
MTRAIMWAGGPPPRPDREVRAVRSLIGTEVRHKAADGTVILELPLLDLYDSIVIEYV